MLVIREDFESVVEQDQEQKKTKRVWNVKPILGHFQDRQEIREEKKDNWKWGKYINWLKWKYNLFVLLGCK